MANAITKIKKANLNTYEFHPDSSDEETDPSKEALKTTRTEDLDAMV